MAAPIINTSRQTTAQYSKYLFFFSIPSSAKIIKGRLKTLLCFESVCSVPFLIIRGNYMYRNFQVRRAGKCISVRYGDHNWYRIIARAYYT